MDINKIEDLIKVLENSRAEELSVTKGDSTVAIRKGRKPKSAVAVKSGKPKEAQAAKAALMQPEAHFILAPMVGIFHSSDSVMKVGASIQEGQVVGSIESMKLLNDVVARESGVVAETMVEDGMPVEYGQPLCKIEPA